MITPFNKQKTSLKIAMCQQNTNNTFYIIHEGAQDNKKIHE